MSFNEPIYAAVRDETILSAQTIVPVIHGAVAPRLVVDIGCGEGWFAREFAKLGVDVVALDESVNEEQVREPGGGTVFFKRADLERPGWIEEARRGADLALCLEVAEHLRPEAAEDLVAGLCTLAPVVLFSAAIPGQGGHGHVNEQWPDYWAHLFARHGLACSGALRFSLWERSEVAPWYKQNLLLCASAPRLARLLEGYTSWDWPPLSVVHPIVFEHRRKP